MQGEWWYDTYVGMYMAAQNMTSNPFTNMNQFNGNITIFYFQLIIPKNSKN